MARGNTTQRQFSGGNQDSIQEMNRTLVLNIIRGRGVCSRSEIAVATQLKQATITYIVNDLMNWNLIRETGPMEGKPGRKSIGLELNPDAFHVIGVRFTRNHFIVATFNLVGEILMERQGSIDIKTGSDAVMAKIIEECRQLLALDPLVISAGAAIPGPFMKNEGRIALMSEFPGWETVNIKDEFHQGLALPVSLIHDANAGALAEWWFGKHRLESGTLLYIAAGQGIGCGILENGKLFEGAQGIAGEIGHMSICYDGPQCACGNRGCLEMYSSMIAMKKYIMNQLDRYPDSMIRANSTLQEIQEAIAAGDELGLKAFDMVVRYLGVGIINAVNAYNPNLIVIGDELSRHRELLLANLRETVRPGLLPSLYDKLVIDTASFDHDPALVGAGALAVEYLFERPSYFEKRSIISESGIQTSD